jgi:hypothetical protein
VCERVIVSNWYRTGLFDDAIASLSRSEEEVRRLSDDPDALKWALIALHSTVQGFMALVLEQGNGLLLMPKKDTAEWLEAHYGDKAYPETRMDRFLNLYAKIKRQECMQGIMGAVPFKNDGHDREMKSLNRLRNQFIHFNVGGWSIEISGLQILVSKVIDVVDYAYLSPLFPWHRYDDAEKLRDRIRNHISLIRAICEKPFAISGTRA